MSATDDLLNYLSDNRRDPPHGLTVDKFHSRAMNIKEEGDCVHFEMERHKAGLGSTYTPGASMSVCMRRIEGYSYCSKSNELSSWTIRNIPLDISDIDFDGLAEDFLSMYSFSVEERDDGTIHLTESTCNDDWLVSSLDDAIVKAGDVVERIDYDVIDVNCELDVSEEEKKSITSAFKEAAYDVIAAKVEFCWDDAELD